MSHFEALKQKLIEIGHIRAAAGVLTWDQEVMMPKGSARGRAGQLATLYGLHHEKFVHEAGELLEKVEQEEMEQLDDFQKRNLSQFKREHEKYTKIPTEHVKEFTRLRSEALGAWVEAKQKQDFSLFEPKLAALVGLKIKETEYLGYEEDPYDALVDQFEPEMKASTLEEIFGSFRKPLGELLDDIRNSGQVEESFILQEIEKQKQLDWGLEVVGKLGYDLATGRQDLSAHPMTIGIDPMDVRITTMVSNTDIREMLYSSIHEAGHAMYEQGLPFEHFGLPACEACSLSIHESQSRLWENNVGRSLAFWEHFYDSFRKLFPDLLAGKSPEDVFRAVNRVSPNFIRISSDELTYHFHIMLRFEIERALVNKEITVKDLPAIWNEKVRDYLGLEVPNDAQGVLQDIHWSHGNLGYFPTYSLGSFYAAQFMHHAKAAMPGLESSIASGDFSGLKTWLSENIFCHGRQYTADKLCEMTTGETLNVKYFVDYAREKFGRVYALPVA